MAFEMMDAEDALETLTRKVAASTPTLTIAVPTYRDHPGALITALMKCEGASDAALLIYDDGTGDDALTAAMSTAIMNWPGTATLITASANAGRAHARNRLLDHAGTDWILFLDADMLPDNANFLTRYRTAMSETDGPALIVGGYSLDQVTPTRAQSLHAAQARKSECLPVNTRAQSPGRYVFTSNLLVHRNVMNAVAFDDAFTGWGWEDTDWGLRVAEHYSVRHIDNTATHLGLDDADTLLQKYGSSGANFARLTKKHPSAAADMTLTKAARRIACLPARALIRGIAKLIARAPLPVRLRLVGLKLYRAACYAEHL